MSDVLVQEGVADGNGREAGAALPGERSAAHEPAPSVSPAPLTLPTRPWLMTVVLLGADIVSLSAAMSLAVLLRWLLADWLTPGFYPAMYLQMWPLLGLFVAAYAAVKLYPAAPLAPAEELRRLTSVTSLVFLGLATSTVLMQEAQQWSRGMLLMSWALALVMVPGLRATLRAVLSPRPWWGYSVLVLGNTPTAARVVQTLRLQPEIGLKPVAVIGEAHQDGERVDGVPVIGGLRRARSLGRRYQVSYAIVAMPQLHNDRLGPLLERLSSTFHHLIFLPELAGFSSLWVTATDLGGTLGLEVRHRLVDPGRRGLKRALDLCLTLSSAPLWLPLVGLIGLLIKLDSKGPMFFGHQRIGTGGRLFTAWKFRSMVQDADAVLEDALANDPALRDEWQCDQKLRRDARLTRVGAWLRKTSLDELPQLWNVLKGEMSLVGPRPIIVDEVPKYGSAFSLYKKVLPGITGMWQVSGRNNLSYDRRVHLDAYYVRNWSVWLDLHLLARTFLAVLLARGAY